MRFMDVEKEDMNLVGGREDDGEDGDRWRKKLPQNVTVSRGFSNTNVLVKLSPRQNTEALFSEMFSELHGSWFKGVEKMRRLDSSALI